MSKRFNIWWLLVAAGCIAAGASLLVVLLAQAPFEGRAAVLVLDGALLGFGLPLVIREFVVPAVRPTKDSPANEAAVTPAEEAEQARLEVKARAASEAGARQAVQTLTDENRALRSQLGELVQPHLARYGALTRFGFDLATLYLAGGPAASPPDAVNDLLHRAGSLGLTEAVSAQIDHDLHAPSPGTAAGDPVRRVFRDLLAALPESADTHFRAAIDAGRWLSLATLSATRNTRIDESLRGELAADLRRIYVESEIAATTTRVLLQFEKGALSGSQVLPWLALLKHYVEERAQQPASTPSVVEFTATGPFADAARTADDLARCVDLVGLYSPSDAALMRQATGGAG